MILVTGSTGFIGRHTVRQLMADGLPVRCLVQTRQLRRGLPWDAEADNAPQIIEGHILDDEAVFQAVTGAHTIIHLDSAMWWGRRRELERIEIAGTRNLLSIARSARVGRVITLSHLGAMQSSAYLLHSIKGQVEEAVRNSGLAFTIIRSGIAYGEDDAFINHIAMMLANNPFAYLMPGQGETILHPMYIADLVRVLTATLENMDTVDRTLEVGGAEYTTYEDLLYTVMRVTGIFRPVVSIAPYAMRLIANIYRRTFPRSLMTPQWLDILATNRTARLGNVYDYFGFQPRRFEDTLLTYLPHRTYFWRGLGATFRRHPRSI
jgi:uncharacterized protein YbjT (DUF2867 family)